MTALSLLEILPAELIKQILTSLYDAKDQGSFNAAMQTCSAMRLLCSGLISRLVVRSDPSALSTFPRHSMIKTLDLWPIDCGLRYHEDDNVDVMTLWLKATQAAAGHRLGSVGRLNLHIGPSVDGSFMLLPILARFCPSLRSLSIYEQGCPGFNLSVLPLIPFPCLEELYIENCNLDENSFSPVHLPTGLRSLRLPHTTIGDKWAAHLANMRCLSNIEISQFDLRNPLVLPDGCAWRQISGFPHLLNDFKYLSGNLWPSNWPRKSELRMKYCSSLDCEISSAEDLCLAKCVAEALSRLPLRKDDGSLPTFLLSLSGTHASPAVFAPLSAFITSVELENPTALQLSEMTAHLPHVTTYSWPTRNTSSVLRMLASEEFKQVLMEGLISATNINSIKGMPYKLVKSFAMRVSRDVTISVERHRGRPKDDPKLEKLITEVSRLRMADGKARRVRIVDK